MGVIRGFDKEYLGVFEVVGELVVRLDEAEKVRSGLREGADLLFFWRES